MGLQGSHFDMLNNHTVSKKDDNKQHIATGVVTVHDEFWTVHSSLIGAEMMRKHIRKIQRVKKEAADKKVTSMVKIDKSVSDSIKVTERL